MGIVCLSPLPVASNRPIFWMLWTGLIGLIAAIYLVMTLSIDPKRKSRSVDHIWIWGLALMVPVVGMIQILPWFNIPVLAPGLELTRATLSVDPYRTTYGILRSLGYIAFFVLCLEVLSQQRRAERLAWVVFIAICAYALFALVSLLMLDDFVLWSEKEQHQGTARGTFINRNSFATFLGMGMCLGLGLTLSRSYQKRIRDPYGRHRGLIPDMNQLLLFISIGIIGLALLYTQSRLGLMASVVGLVVCYIGFHRKQGNSIGRAFLIVVILGVVGVLLALFVYEAQVLDRALFIERNAETRFALYASMIKATFQHPFFGIGLDAFEPAFQQIHDQSVQSGRRWDLGHSTYLTNWMEMGLFFGSVPVVIGVLVLRNLVRLIRSRATQFVFPVIGLSALVVAALHSTMDFSLEIAANTYLLLFLLALGLARRNDISESGQLN